MKNMGCKQEYYYEESKEVTKNSDNIAFLSFNFNMLYIKFNL